MNHPFKKNQKSNWLLIILLSFVFLISYFLFFIFRFNCLERRSKTPNILYSSTSQSNIGNYQINSNKNSNLNNLNPCQVPLRSKTPTTDRMLFSSSSQFNNDCIYFANNNTNTNAHPYLQKRDPVS